MTAGAVILSLLIWGALDLLARRRRVPISESTTSRPIAPPDIHVLLTLLAVAIRAGAPIPRALLLVGRSAGGGLGTGIASAGAALIGQDWDAAWANVIAEYPQAKLIAGALKQSWLTGTAPADELARAAERARLAEQDRHRLAASRLGVRLVLPLGLCFLPAFILIGLGPVVMSLVAGAFT